MKFGILLPLLLAFASPGLAQSRPTTNSTVNITLTWSPTPSVPSAGVPNYSIWWGTQPSNYTTGLAVGTNIWCVVSNLARGSTYYFAVVATDTNANTTSPYSAPASSIAAAIPATIPSVTASPLAQ